MISGLLRERTGGSTICPSEAARALRDEGWIEIMERARAAARRLCAKGLVEIVQHGRRVDPSRARGPIRIRLTPRGLASGMREVR